MDNIDTLFLVEVLEPDSLQWIFTGGVWTTREMAEVDGERFTVGFDHPAEEFRVGEWKRATWT
jgi:hypothetical protein